MNRRKMKKMDKTSSNQYIPPEVLTQILANLPAKSVLTFRCVCKSWCSIIDNPEFLSMHRQFCNNSSNSIKLLALEILGRRGTRGCLLTLRKPETIRKIGHIFKSDRGYFCYLHGICDSLLLVCSHSRYFYSTSLRLCNPSIRKLLTLPPCPLISCFPYYFYTFVLGFAANIGDYKVIAIAFEDTTSVKTPNMRVSVYTLNDQQWAGRDNGLNIDCLTNKHLFGPYYFCDGAAHWLGKDPYRDTSNQEVKPTHLVSLDFDTERFTFLELPHALDEVDTISRSLFLLGKSLATFCISPVSLKIWVLKQQNGKREWTLWFSGPSSSDGFDLFKNMGSKTSRVLYCESDGGRLVFKKKAYNITSCQVQLLGKSMSRYVELVKYSESLVLRNRDETENMV